MNKFFIGVIVGVVIMIVVDWIKNVGWKKALKEIDSKIDEIKKKI